VMATDFSANRHLKKKQQVIISVRVKVSLVRVRVVATVYSSTVLWHTLVHRCCVCKFAGYCTAEVSQTDV